jgi:hypothetical protein
MKPTIRSSSLDRGLSCHGSPGLEQLVDARRGDEGDEGKLLHGKVARRLVKELGATCEAGIPPATPKAPATDWIVAFCFNAVKEGTPPDWSMEVEMGLAYEWDRFILSGHPDVVAISPDATEFLVDDFKTGYVPVDIAEMNWQLLAYAVLLRRAYPTLLRGRLRIIQPRNNEDDGFPRISETVVDNLEAAEATLVKHINAMLDDQMSLDTGWKQCRFCPVGAALQCPAQKKLKDSMKHTLTIAEISAITRTPDDAKLGDWVMDMRSLSGPTDAAEKLLKKRIKENGAVDAGNGTHITIKTQGGSYSFPDRAAYYKALTELIPDADQRAKAIKFSVTDTKDVIAEVYQIPKTGQAPQTAAGVFDAKLRVYCEQGVKELFVFQ